MQGFGDRKHRYRSPSPDRNFYRGSRFHHPSFLSVLSVFRFCSLPSISELIASPTAISFIEFRKMCPDNLPRSELQQHYDTYKIAFEKKQSDVFFHVHHQENWYMLVVFLRNLFFQYYLMAFFIHIQNST
jgi:hypothetical protein